MTDRDKRFCTEYMVDMNAEAAAIRAGYKPATARNAAAWIHPEHPKKKEVRKEIDRLIARRAARTEVTAEKVIKELAKIAFANIADVVDKHGEFLADADRDDTAAVASVKVKTGDDWVEKEVKLCDKGFALKLLGTHLGIFTEKLQLDGPLPVIIDDIGEAEEAEDGRRIGFDAGDADGRDAAE